MQNSLLTGASQGLGLGLFKQLQAQGSFVTSIGIHEPENSDHHIKCDFANLATLQTQLLVGNLKSEYQLVILNSGILGSLGPVQNTSLVELQNIMNINVWANKVILDFLINNKCKVEQLVLISSGASVSGSRGWSGYSLSKATANMLMQLYSHEMTGTHISAIAPGLIESKMQEQIRSFKNSDEFPVFERLRQAANTEAMQSPETAAINILNALPKLRSHPSGSFLDLRQL